MAGKPIHASYGTGTAFLKLYNKIIVIFQVSFIIKKIHGSRTFTKSHMNIEIIGSESLGVRGLCCFVKTKGRKILIDPGIALGYMRHKLLPHPVQVAMGEKIQKKIISAWKESTDIVISHFHGDHVPLADANPYQLNIDKLAGLKQDIRIWTKESHHFFIRTAPWGIAQQFRNSYYDKD